MVTQMKTAIIIPAYNEEKYISTTLKGVKKYADPKDIYVVDDGSGDTTIDLAKKEQVHVLSYKKNAGKGYALRYGCDHVYKTYDAIIIMDADGQHEPKDIPRMLRQLEKNDIVFTYRKGNQQPVRFKLGNWGLTLITWFFSGNIFNGIYLRDVQCGFRAFRTSHYEQLRWENTGYVVENEMIMRSHNLKRVEIPIAMIYLDENKGTTIATGFRIFGDLLLFVIRRLLKGNRSK